MNTLIKSFDAFNQKYQERRDGFKARIQKLKLRGSEKVSMRCQYLFDEIETLIQIIKNEFSNVVQAGNNHDAIKKNIKRAKKAYKELFELTKPVWRQWIEAVVVALVLALILRNFLFGLYHVPTGSAEKTILVGDRIWGNKVIYFFSPVKRGDLVIFDDPTFKYDRDSTFRYLWQRYIGFPVPLLGLSNGPANWVKRVIAVPGDTIEGRLEDGKTAVYLNGKKLDEPYVNKLPLITLHKSSGFIPFSNIGPLAVPSFLRYTTKNWIYTYDPAKSFEDQPYYRMEEKDIVRDDNNQPELTYAYTPCYDQYSTRCRDVFGPYVIPNGAYWVMGDNRKNSQDSRWWLFLNESLIHGRAGFIIYSIDSEEAFWLFDLIKHPIDFWTKHVRWNRFFKWLDGYEVNK